MEDYKYESLTLYIKEHLLVGCLMYPDMLGWRQDLIPSIVWDRFFVSFKQDLIEVYYPDLI